MGKLEIVEDFKTRFNKALELRNKKPIDVVRATGISESAISQYRTGLNKPKRERLALIANYLNVNPTWLLGLDVPMEIPKVAPPVTPYEFDYVQKIRMLDKYGHDAVMDTIERELHRCNEQNGKNTDSAV